MDHSMAPSMTMAMSATTGTSHTMPTSTAGHSMSMGGPGSCKISMLWNWYTIDSCFIARSWHVTSHGMFAGSCIGVILLVMLLELFRRAAKEYDRFLISQASKAHSLSLDSTSSSDSHARLGSDRGTGMATKGTSTAIKDPCASDPHGQNTFRPSVWQQGIRALLHMVQFALAYFVMLLAMYYNGYIIICIFIGAYIGYFVFGWESLRLESKNDRMQEGATVCCG